MINLHSKAIPATGLAAAAAVGIALATSVPAAGAPDLVGSGCSAYASAHPDGPASVAGMSQDPVAVAASNNPELSTLTAAVSGKLNPQVNLVDTLNNGQYTVFAPTDAAFSKLPASTIDHLKTDANMLKSILTYHVVPGRVMAAQVVKMNSAKTVNGQTISISASGGTVMVNNAKVVKTDIICSNGVIHVIDAVLMPK